MSLRNRCPSFLRFLPPIPWAFCAPCKSTTICSEIADVRHVGVRDLSSHRLGRHHWRCSQSCPTSRMGPQPRELRTTPVRQAGSGERGCQLWNLYMSFTICRGQVALWVWRSSQSCCATLTTVCGGLNPPWSVSRSLSPAGRGQSFPVQDQQACTGNPSVPLVPLEPGFLTPLALQNCEMRTEHRDGWIIQQ